ncbi:MAG: 4Fe-4S cluster-binding domain-containing protein [Clostridia bacterium]|nr:4Fe-4S cluster-binding domain-containing protein [Clostridia bacterium]
MGLICNLCPRNCSALRDEASGSGFCKMGTLPTLARASVHMWEEPCISGTRGSGTVFFSGCSLRCVYCQNYQISAGGFGEPVTPRRLREIFFSLIEKGVHNINLVNPTHFSSAVSEALVKNLPVPVVWNSGGYDSVGTLRALEGQVQIYLPDLKYMDSSLAAKYSSAPGYPEAAQKAILEMYRQTGPYALDGDGILQKGVVIRHLVLPENLDNTRRVIGWVSENFAPGEVLFSLMSQYTPAGNVQGFPELTRGLNEEEHSAALDLLMSSGIEDGFFQDRGSASESFIPEFDLTGVI